MTTLAHDLRPGHLLAPGNAAAGDPDGSWGRADWQKMWLQLGRRDLPTLALVPGDDHTSTFEVANLMARLALEHGAPIHVADVRALGLEHLEAFLEGARWEVSQGARIVFATGWAATSLATVPVAQAARCAVLCISPGTTSLDAARATVDEIGREFFLGSLLVRAPPGTRPSKRALSPPARSAKRA